MQNTPRWVRRLDGTPFITYALLAVTISVFALETLAGGSESVTVLIRFGARYNTAIWMGEWWRFITPIFLHIGLTHILMNGLTLYFLGVLCEQVFGHWRFLTIYLVSGIAGNVASFVFNPDVVSAGASTALFGLMGAFLLLGDTFRHQPQVGAVARQFAVFAAINLIFNLFSSSVDIYGHIGGLIGGFLIAGLLGAPNIGEMPRWRQVISGVFLIGVLGFLLHFGYTQALL
ncbi:rhomboid family intramembrane serine protease [Lacticaseibacillus yichunensis]|uniref:Rhomboid family intramembrane serine protease n=1 Tax=Lacticaseibacillus yichunensis TaxID=2486015 RepID=A0ABW4CMQ1_9LACO|nr:rhomboid family intramembrane serine protease [Lacticaseibacillus yichunensis]